MYIFKGTWNIPQDHILHYSKRLNKFKKIESLSGVFSDHTVGT